MYDINGLTTAMYGENYEIYIYLTIHILRNIICIIFCFCFLYFAFSQILLFKGLLYKIILTMPSIGCLYIFVLMYWLYMNTVTVLHIFFLTYFLLSYAWIMRYEKHGVCHKYVSFF